MESDCVIVCECLRIQKHIFALFCMADAFLFASSDEQRVNSINSRQNESACMWGG